MNISIATHDRGNFILLSIFDVHNEEDILTFEKQFKSEQEIDEFKETELFQKVFNAISKIK